MIPLILLIDTYLTITVLIIAILPIVATLITILLTGQQDGEGRVPGGELGRGL